MKNPRAVKNKWKPVDLDANVINGNLEGLIGIEECTDYNLSDLIADDRVSCIGFEDYMYTTTF